MMIGIVHPIVEIKRHFAVNIGRNAVALSPTCRGHPVILIVDEVARRLITIVGFTRCRVSIVDPCTPSSTTCKLFPHRLFSYLGVIFRYLVRRFGQHFLCTLAINGYTHGVSADKRIVRCGGIGTWSNGLPVAHVPLKDISVVGMCREYGVMWVGCIRCYRCVYRRRTDFSRLHLLGFAGDQHSDEDGS